MLHSNLQSHRKTLPTATKKTFVKYSTVKRDCNLYFCEIKHFLQFFSSLAKNQKQILKMGKCFIRLLGLVFHKPNWIPGASE